MVNLVTKYQYSIFGDFKEEKSDADTFSDLINLFSDYPEKLLPSVPPFNFKVVKPGEGNPVSRAFCLANSQQTLFIILNSSRIDIAKTPQLNSFDNNVNKEDNAFRSDLTYLLEKVYGRYKTNFRRIALVKHYLTDDFGEQKIESAFKNIFNLYDDIAPQKREWTYRIVTRIPRTINSLQETLNVILNVQRGVLDPVQKISAFNKLAINFDINTIPEAKEERFNVNGALNYYDEVSILMKEKLDNYIKHITK